MLNGHVEGVAMFVVGVCYIRLSPLSMVVLLSDVISHFGVELDELVDDPLLSVSAGCMKPFLGVECRFFR